MQKETNSDIKAKKVENALNILENKDNLMQNALNNPYVRFILISATIYGVLYASCYFINTSAETVRAFKNLRNAVRE